MCILNPNGLVFLQKGNWSQRRPQGWAEVKSSHCSWSCDAQANEKNKVLFSKSQTFNLFGTSEHFLYSFCSCYLQYK